MFSTPAEELEDHICNYLCHIRFFHNALKRTFNFDIEPTYNEAGPLFPRKGEFSFDGKQFNYRYHGNGCTLVVDDIIVDYDLFIFDRSLIEITEWKFYRFIESSVGGSSRISTDDLNELFIELSLKGVLIRKYPDRFVFFINNDYFK